VYSQEIYKILGSTRVLTYSCTSLPRTQKSRGVSPASTFDLEQHLPGEGQGEGEPEDFGLLLELVDGGGLVVGQLAGG